ncbi:hypothetical protein [Amycolatopsis nigrescens]|uniref:hypothetical protein n=1 Tax=Amycolatopsis nigrescens TaxID=381445 RepID=UPI000377C4FC|nr:hypothetical protein [Amycolatopsis nigrescens]
MDHHDMPLGSGSAGVDVAALVLRLALLLGSAVVAGAGLLRPLADELPTWLVRALYGLAALAAVLALLSVFTVDANVVGAVVHALLSLAIPALLRWPPVVRWVSAALVLLLVLETALGRSGIEFAIDTVYVAGAATWFGFAVFSVALPRDGWRTSALRPGPLALSLGGILVLAGGVQLVLSGVGFDRRLYQTPFGIALLVIVALPVAVTVLAAILRDHPRRAYGYGAAGVAIGFLAWSALAAVPRPAELPVPGVPLLADVSVAAAEFPVLVSPQRPGRNLVHFPDSAGRDLSVGVAGGLIQQATARAGAEGTWAEVELPAGRTDLVVQRGDATTSVQVDTGSLAALPSAGGPDGPECASAALGGLVNDRRNELAACPADALSQADTDALRKVVGFLASRQAGGLTLVQDSSPRGVEAANVVREAAARSGLPVGDGPSENSALLVVSGWSDGYLAMSRAAEAQREAPVYLHGLYLAPWLLNGPIVNSVASSSVPLRFDPREQLAVSYAVAVGNRFGGESPTIGGFQDWLGDQWKSVNGEVQIFASAQVNAMPMYPTEPHAPGMVMDRNYAGQWVPNGTVVPVSVPLKP